MPILSHMKSIRYNITGIIRENRLAKIPLLTAKQNYLKNKRSSCESVMCKKKRNNDCLMGTQFSSICGYQQTYSLACEPCCRYS